MYQRILAALEGKESDEALVAHARRLAEQTKARVILPRVIVIANDGGGGLGRQFQLEVGSSGWRRKNQAEADLSRLQRRLGLEGLFVETALVIGTRSEADEIVGYAAEGNCDLIAMARDARAWYRRWIDGSPASGVLRKATVPTLFVGDNGQRVSLPRPVPEPDPVLALFGSADL